MVFVVVLLGFITMILSLAQCHRRRVGKLSLSCHTSCHISCYSGLFKHLRQGRGKLSDVIETLNIRESSIKKSRAVTEDMKTIEENIELLSVKRDDET